MEDLFGNFGTMFLSITSGFIGFILRDFFTNRKQRKSNTLAIASEFESESMIKARIQADKEVLPRDGSDPKDLIEEYETNLQNIENIMRLIHFYQRLTILKENGEICEELAQKLFSENYIFWNEHYFLYQRNAWFSWCTTASWLLPKNYKPSKKKLNGKHGDTQIVWSSDSVQKPIKRKHRGLL